MPCPSSPDLREGSHHELCPVWSRIGFASNLPERLRAHRCSAPFATVVATWPCLLLWEKTAIDCVTQKCERIHTEVYRTGDIPQVKNRGDQFFALMPDVE